MNNMKNFSERLKELMFYKDNIKSEQLGTEIGVSGQTIRAWCDGSQNIFLSNLLKLANYFCCSIEFLVGRSQTMLDFSPHTCPNFYEHFRKVLKEKNISRYRMTKESKIKDSYFTTWQNGADPHVLSLIEAADYLNVAIDYLVGREQ